ncbi:MAG: hypothetical protein V3V04_03600 [Rhizobiaceae bacterium]
MSALPQLDTRHAEWDKYRGAVMIPCGKNQLAITIEALESWMNCTLNPEEAVDTVIDEKAMFSAIANATPAHDNIIMITSGILNSRSWTVEPFDDGPEDSGPIYLQPMEALRGNDL